MLSRLVGHTLKLGIGPGDNRGVHGPVGLHSVSLVGILVGGGALKGHILVLIPGPMLGHMRLYLMGRVLVLHPTPCQSLNCTQSRQHTHAHAPNQNSDLATLAVEDKDGQLVKL